MRSQSYHLLRFLSRMVVNLRRRLPYYFSALKPVGPHLYRNRSSLKTKGHDLRAHENMAGILILMDYPWISPHRHQQQNGVGEVMVMHPLMATEETATACKSIKMAIIIRMKHPYQYRP